MIVVDTNVASELMRPSPSPLVQEWVSAHVAGELCTTAITVAEIRYGLERLRHGRRKDRLLAAADEVFTAFSDYVLPFDADAVACYALVVAHRERIGLPIEGFDAQIAAICRARGAALATRNVKDFQETGIGVINPWQASRGDNGPSTDADRNARFPPRGCAARHDRAEIVADGQAVTLGEPSTVMAHS
jgi:predicted nucleic acid-binding protein